MKEINIKLLEDITIDYYYPQVIKLLKGTTVKVMSVEGDKFLTVFGLIDFSKAEMVS